MKLSRKWGTPVPRGFEDPCPRVLTWGTQFRCGVSRVIPFFHDSLSFKKARFMRFPSIALLFGALATSFSYAQTASPSAPFEGEPFTATAAQLNAASAAMPADKQFPAIVLYAEGVYRIAADGTLDFRHRVIYRVDSADGMKNWAEISSNWDPWYEKPAQLHARVLGSDGRFTELDQKTITDA